jgi:hypothetical protein
MFSRLIALSPAHRRWCMYAMILLAPGSLFVLPVFWLVRMLGQASRHGSVRSAGTPVICVGAQVSPARSAATVAD